MASYEMSSAERLAHITAKLTEDQLDRLTLIATGMDAERNIMSK